jgi:hypothetical protein
MDNADKMRYNFGRYVLMLWYTGNFILTSALPRVEAGKNTSTVTPASRKRRQNGNPVVSGETVAADLREG